MIKFINKWLCFSLLFMGYGCDKGDSKEESGFLKGEWENSQYIFPLAGIENAACFHIKSDFYVGLGVIGKDVENFFCRFVPDKGWMAIKDFPGQKRSHAVTFVLDDKAYVGLGIVPDQWEGYCKDFWVYDPKQDCWDSLQWEFPGKGRIGAVGFTVGDKAYVGTGFNREDDRELGDFYQFDPVKGWKPLPQAVLNGRVYATTFHYGNTAYLCFGAKGGYPVCRDVYKFSSEKESWIPLRSLTMEEYPDIVRQNATAIELYENNKEYIYVLGGNPDCWVCRYNPREDTWIEVKEAIVPKTNLYFTVDNKLYAVLDNLTYQFVPLKE